jgi:hypothetical protein
LGNSFNYSDLTSRFARAAGVVLVFTCLGILLVFLALSLYTHPADVDDFCLANEFKAFGIFGGLVRQYMIWSGGYTSTFISGAVPNLFDYLEIYKFLPITLLLLTVFAVARCVAAICRLQQPAAWPYLVGVGFTVLFLAIMQSVVMGFYWFNGAVTYHLADIILVGMVTLIIRILDDDGGQALQSRRFVYLGLLIVAGMGCTETVMVEMFVLLNFVCLWQIFVARERRRGWMVLLALVYFCFLLVVLAPGNIGRSSHIVDVYSDQHTGIQFLQSLWASIYYGFRDLLRLLTLPYLWWSTLIVVLLFSRYGRRLGSFRKIRSFHVLLGIIVTLSLPAVLQFPWQLMQSGPTHVRTQNAITFGFLLSWFSTWAMITFRYWSYKEPVLSIQPVSVPYRLANGAACLALSITLFGNSNITLAYSDLVSKAVAYDQYMQQRYARLKDAASRGERSVTVKLYHELPTTISIGDVNGNMVGTNIRTCIGLYFGFESMNIE